MSETTNPARAAHDGQTSSTTIRFLLFHFLMVVEPRVRYRVALGPPPPHRRSRCSGSWEPGRYGKQLARVLYSDHGGTIVEILRWCELFLILFYFFIVVMLKSTCFFIASSSTGRVLVRRAQSERRLRERGALERTLHWPSRDPTGGLIVPLVLGVSDRLSRGVLFKLLTSLSCREIYKLPNVVAQPVIA